MNAQAWLALSQNPTLKWRHVLAQPDLPWVFPKLARFPQLDKLPDEFVRTNRDWSGISSDCHPKLVRAYPEADWIFRALSGNPNVDIDLVVDFVSALAMGLPVLDLCSTASLGTSVPCPAG
jgi:hypothetical protein